MSYTLSCLIIKPILWNLNMFLYGFAQMSGVEMGVYLGCENIFVA